MLFRSLGQLLTGAAITILGRGTVTAQPGGVVVNAAVISSDTTDLNPNNNTAAVIIPVVQVEQLADLAVTKSADREFVVPGNMLTYTLSVANHGPDVAQSVVLADSQVLSTLTNVQYSQDGGITWYPWPGALALGDLANGAIATVQIRGLVAWSCVGSLLNTATVSSQTDDPNPANNTASVTTCILVCQGMCGCGGGCCCWNACRCWRYYDNRCCQQDINGRTIRKGLPR